MKKIIGEHEDEIAEKFGVDMITDLFQLAEDADFAVPWHAKATYGEEEDDFIPAVDICTKEIAADLTERCQRAFDTAKRFFAGAAGE